MGANIQGGAAPHPRDDPRVTRRLRKLYAERAPIDARDASSLWWRGPSDQIDRKDLEMAVLRHELGAEAAWMGTQFIVAEESTAHPEYEDRVTAAHETDAVLSTGVFATAFPNASDAADPKI